MITDKETNFVYFSSLIKVREQYASFWQRLEKILIRRKIGYGFIQNTRDIWCRDYMPIQVDIDKFIQFNFFPDYCLTPQYISKLTIQDEIWIPGKITPKHVDLIIDGGNFVKSTSQVILTEKVLKENPKLSKKEIVDTLKKEIDIDNVFLIPQQPYDMTGHADGMVRFLNDTDLLVADYSYESKSWRIKMDKALEKTGLNIIPYPSKIINERNKDGDYTAKGTYINFLQFDRIIIFPLFGLDTDDYALQQTREFFPFHRVIPIESNEIAIDGGVLNCIAWNIKTIQDILIDSLPQKRHDREAQEIFVLSQLGFYLSTSDYLQIAKTFEFVWNCLEGRILGDEDIKSQVYHFLNSQETFQSYPNPIPQKHIYQTVDLILKYREDTGQSFPSEDISDLRIQ
ncbi:MAG: agmatine deiminase family protein [Parabacteroides sp.]|nr:agmatine deiminase family protein [Parabacteroides sp.]